MNEWSVETNTEREKPNTIDVFFISSSSYSVKLYLCWTPPIITQFLCSVLYSLNTISVTLLNSFIHSELPHLFTEQFFTHYSINTHLFIHSTFPYSLICSTLTYTFTQYSFTALTQHTLTLTQCSFSALIHSLFNQHWLSLSLSLYLMEGFSGKWTP